jgi:hypothetical protein
MTEPSGVIRQISWRDLFPWLILLRTFRIAIAPSLLAVATLTVILSPIGWRLAGLVFLTEQQRQALTEANAALPQAASSRLAALTPHAVREYLPEAPTALLDAYISLAEPLARFFQLNLTLGETAYYLFGALWTLALWAFPGGLITRRAVVQLATETAPALKSTAEFTARRYLWYALTPLYPLVGVLALAVPIVFLGVPLQVSLDFGSVLAGLFWLFVILASLGALWLLAGLLFGWPLMWPTISAERDGDTFEAFSRSFSYVYGKPLHYFFYVVIAAAFGALCWAVVAGAALIVQEFGFWALSWGGGSQAVGQLRDQALAVAAGALPGEDVDRGFAVGATLVGWCVALIHAIATAFRYTFFFTAASAIYLLLRHDVDEKEMDEVYVESASPAPPASHSPPAIAPPPPAAPTPSA